MSANKQHKNQIGASAACTCAGLRSGMHMLLAVKVVWMFRKRTSGRPSLAQKPRARESRVMTLRGNMDVITRTTFHLQARNRCGTDAEPITKPKPVPSRNRSKCTCMHDIATQIWKQYSSNLMALFQRYQRTAPSDDGRDCRVSAGILHRCARADQDAGQEGHVCVGSENTSRYFQYLCT